MPTLDNLLAGALPSVRHKLLCQYVGFFQKLRISTCWEVKVLVHSVSSDSLGWVWPVSLDYASLVIQEEVYGIPGSCWRWLEDQPTWKTPEAAQGDVLLWWRHQHHHWLDRFSLCVLIWDFYSITGGSCTPTLLQQIMQWWRRHLYLITMN